MRIKSTKEHNKWAVPIYELTREVSKGPTGANGPLVTILKEVPMISENLQT